MMKDAWKKLLGGVALLALTLNLGVAADAKVGEAAPNFKLTDTNGTEHSLSDFKGKVVVLEWINHGCPFVKKFYKPGEMQKLQKAATDKGVVWLSICSSAEGKQGYMTADDWNKTNKKMNYAGTAVLLDTDGKVGKMYGAKTTPQMYVIDAEGKLAYMGAIDSIKSTKSEDIAKADNYVMPAVEAVLAGKTPEKTSTKPYGCSVKYAK